MDVPANCNEVEKVFRRGRDCLKSKSPPCEDWKFVVAPVVGYRLFNSSRDFSDSLGRGKPVLLTQGFGLAPALDLPQFWTCPGFGLARLWTCSGFWLAPVLDLPRFWTWFQYSLKSKSYVKCKKITCITLNLQYIDVQGDSMNSILSIDATYFLNITMRKRVMRKRKTDKPSFLMICPLWLLK